MTNNYKPTMSELAERRCAHLTPIEWRFARELKVLPKDVEGPPVAAIVGEAPGPTGGAGSLAMFPWPRHSAGGRLLEISGMPPGIYLGRFHRRNLYDEVPDGWRLNELRGRALAVETWAQERGLRRVVVLGAHCVKAFDLDGFFIYRTTGEESRRFGVVAIPHPSGLNPMYNDPNIRLAARDALIWAAGLSPRREEADASQD